ncbi:glycosyltransferase family 4 protein [Aerococcaceae bacterium NML130460]|nr:glycosyltransferase family 4 protein [Aerococcaceae bacterium NML171108]MCW6680189.1 glycosyltransferase family 4 protein [Aerococcaceae bacterium NML130460]
MRILFTTHTYAPNRDGVQFVTQYLAEGLVKLGHEVSVVTYLYPDRTDVTHEVINGVNVMRWEASTKKTFHVGDRIGYQKYIIDNQQQFDVIVNVGTQTALTDWLFPVSGSIKVPRVLYIHSIWDFKLYAHDFRHLKAFLAKVWANIRWRVYYWLNKAELQKYALVTQLHEMDDSCRFFKEKYGIASKIMENAADESFFTEASIDVKQLGNYILNVSNYNHRKNQKLCIETFLKSDVPSDWRLVLIGSRRNAYYDELVAYEKRLRHELNLGEDKPVEILVDIPRADISSYVKQAQIYFMTSLWEAFPISIVEAMAAGVPFVSSDVGIVKYLPGGVVADDTSAFGYWLELFTKEPSLRQLYGSSGNEMALKYFRIEDKVKQFERYLTEAIHNQDKH